MNVQYYKFEREQDAKYATRLIETASTRDHLILEAERKQEDNKRYGHKKGCLYIRYVYRPTNYGTSSVAPDYSISMGKFNLSSIHVLGLSTNVAYGDVYGSNDAILFLLHNMGFVHGGLSNGASLEMFVFKGQKTNRKLIAQRYANGDSVMVRAVEDARNRANMTNRVSTRTRTRV